MSFKTFQGIASVGIFDGTNQLPLIEAYISLGFKTFFDSCRSTRKLSQRFSHDFGCVICQFVRNSS